MTTEERILLPIDGSEGAAKAARWAARYAAARKGVVTLLLVQDAGGLTSLGLEALSREEVDEAKERLASEVFNQVEPILRELGVEVEHEVAFGDPAEEICSVAARHGHGLIVMGTRGRSGFARLLIGGVTNKVLHHAPCPVTVVR